MATLQLNEYKRHESVDTNTVEFTPTIYRYKFTEDFMTELYNFAKIHQYDHRNDFKEAWVKWSEDNSDIIINETERLLVLGYQNEDNIDDKMFKSARYYFRKKSPIKPEPKQRRQYISVDHDLLAAMDRHIANNIYNKPEAAFILFCKDNEAILRQSVAQICAHGVTDSQSIQSKIKKTYKNRYFILTNK